MLKLVFLISLLLIGPTQMQNPSPCPEILTYEQKGVEQDRWYAQLLLTSPTSLTGIWLRIILDERADLLGNWFGESSSSDNKEFLIRNRSYQLDANHEPLLVRFFVKYNTAAKIPSVVGVRLNGNTICSASVAGGTTTTPKLFISNSRATTQATTNRPRTSTTESNGDDEVFSGDLSPSRRPIIPNLTSSSGTQVQACGTVIIRAQPLITFGQNTVEGEWPWHVALYRSKGFDLQYICGGSLISPRHVLTAAHCVTKPRTTVTVNPNLFTVYLGKYSLFKLGPTVQDRTIQKIERHPEYDASYLNNDIAVLHLSNAVEITDFVRTVCLWEEDINLTSVIDKLGTIVGWGYDQNGNVTENLMQAKMPIVSTETCIFSNREFFSRFTSAKTFCAGYRNGTSACTGDSGGGMVFPKSSTNGASVVWQLRGIISLSAALQSEKLVCDTSNYVVFTDVAKHLDWVRKAMES